MSVPIVLYMMAGVHMMAIGSVIGAENPTVNPVSAPIKPDTTGFSDDVTIAPMIDLRRSKRLDCVSFS